MEEPFLGESSTYRKARGSFDKRSDAIAHGTRYQKAAALIDLAEDGVGLPEKILDQSTFGSSAKLYFIFIQFDLFWSIIYFTLLLMNFLERPSWCGTHPSYYCENRDYYYQGMLPYMTHAQLVAVEGILLAVILAHTFFPIAYEGSHIFWRNSHNQIKVTCVMLLIIDSLVYASSLLGISILQIRIAPYLRVALLILNFRGLWNCVLLLTRMLLTYLNVMALWFLFVIFSSWLAYVMFEDTLQGATLFTSYWSTLYHMFILFTTSNNPDVWIPAYKASRWYCLFFILYLLLAVYFVTNLILAVVYDSFKCQLAKQVMEMDCMRKSILRKAFTLIDDHTIGFLSKEQCILLFHEVNKYRTLPKISNEDFEFIFDELDDSHDFKINVDEFSDLCNAIALRFQKEDARSCFENYPSVYHSWFSEKLKAFVHDRKFDFLISSILMLNLVAVIIETMLDIENDSAQKLWQVVEFFFGWIYVLEMVLKIYSYGFRNYWRDGQNRFDFLVTCIIVIGETLTFFSPGGLTFLSNGEWIRYLLLARMLRLIRLLMHVKSYRAFIATFFSLIPSLLPYLGTIFCVLCIYCTLGIQIFGGIVNAGNPQLNDTDLASDDYVLFNFNDYPNGMVTLFNLLIMGNWHVWMESYRELTGSSWTIAYFISFYLISVLLLLNLVVAFVLEAFFAEMELESPDKTEAEKDSRVPKHRPRSIGLKTRSQRIELLLHHMLRAELKESNNR